MSDPTSTKGLFGEDHGAPSPMIEEIYDLDEHKNGLPTTKEASSKYIKDMKAQKRQEALEMSKGRKKLDSLCARIQKNQEKLDQSTDPLLDSNGKGIKLVKALTEGISEWEIMDGLKFRASCLLKGWAVVKTEIQKFAAELEQLRKAREDEYLKNPGVKVTAHIPLGVTAGRLVGLTTRLNTLVLNLKKSDLTNLSLAVLGSGALRDQIKDFLVQPQTAYFVHDWTALNEAMKTVDFGMMGVANMVLPIDDREEDEWSDSVRDDNEKSDS